MAPPVIRILPAEVVERIAAGEVIERPSSAVRELLDNALDAGATAISVEVRAAGLDLIRVADDGHGIADDQVELAFQRHATSKIRSEADLLALDTLGFRGEALPSLAAVAEVSMFTRDEAADLGTLLVMRAGTIEARERAARQRGTTVTVRNLFHTLPARRKYLGPARGEAGRILQMVRRYALARPKVRFSLTLDDRLALRTSGNEDLATTLGEVYGSGVIHGLIPVDAALPGAGRLSGLLAGRSTTRPSREHLAVAINGRPTTSPALDAALEAASRPYLPRGRFPVGALALQVPLADLDPNVHPAKAHVRLRWEAEITATVTQAVREVLGAATTQPDVAQDFSLGAVQYTLPVPRRRVAEPPGPGWGAPSPENLPIGRMLAEMVIVGQVQDSLILAESPEGVFLVDQHRAHERAIYETLAGQPGSLVARPQAQTLLEPVLLEVKPQHARLLEERLVELESLGFACERFGGHSFLVRGVPALPVPDQIVLSLPSLLEEAASAAPGWQERLLASLACRAAVRRNRHLDEPEMRELLTGLATTAAPAVCPHGSPLILRLSGAFLRRQFGW